MWERDLYMMWWCAWCVSLLVSGYKSEWCAIGNMVCFLLLYIGFLLLALLRLCVHQWSYCFPKPNFSDESVGAALVTKVDWIWLTRLHCLQDFKIQNIVGSCDAKFPIRLEGLAYAHGHFSSVRMEHSDYLFRTLVCLSLVCLSLVKW
jgi:hypothetical protein